MLDAIILHDFMEYLLAIILDNINTCCQYSDSGTADPTPHHGHGCSSKSSTVFHRRAWHLHHGWRIAKPKGSKYDHPEVDKI